MSKIINKTESKLVNVANQFADETKKERIKNDLLDLNGYLINIVRPFYIMMGNIEAKRRFDISYQNAVTIAAYAFTSGDISINNIKAIMITTAFYGIKGHRMGYDYETDDINKAIAFVRNQHGLYRFFNMRKSFIKYDVCSILSYADSIICNYNIEKIISDDLKICGDIVADAIMSYTILDSKIVLKMIVGEIMDTCQYNVDLTPERVQNKVKYILNHRIPYKKWRSSYTTDVFGPYTSEIDDIASISLPKVEHAMHCYDNKVHNAVVDMHNGKYDQM